MLTGRSQVSNNSFAMWAWRSSPPPEESWLLVHAQFVTRISSQTCVHTWVGTFYEPHAEYLKMLWTPSMGPCHVVSVVDVGRLTVHWQWRFSHAALSGWHNALTWNLSSSMEVPTKAQETALVTMCLSSVLCVTIWVRRQIPALLSGATTWKLIWWTITQSMLTQAKQMVFPFPRMSMTRWHYQILKNWSFPSLLTHLSWRSKKKRIFGLQAL